MKLIGAASLLAIVLGASALADVQLTQPVINALTQIDSVPSSQQINQAFNGSPSEALASLQQIANPTNFVDRGVQIRAVRALTHYCQSTPCGFSDPAHQTLRDIATLPKYRDSRFGSDLLVLRAAIESLGVLQVPQDVDILIPQLQHPSRDIRAAVARALRDLGNTQAIVPLRARYNIETSEQVQLAISDALRVLGQPVP
ncbi:MAG: HEAT repeat domain-containing protein [Deltaproteobacteria bacterium]|nr:HEAT repeat domain-containing protein [Deltaproteobacteria bacterium]